MAPAPIGPGQAYEVRFGAAPGHFLSFATMMVQSNDLFYAPAGAGIDLYPSGTPLSGDVTDQVMLWDAGTEANEEPGLGMNQAPRQAGPDTGPADSDNTVRLVDDGYTYPAVAEVIEATLTDHGGGEFTLRLENVSDSSTLQPSTGPSVAVPMAPGVFVVHAAADPFFTAGMADAGDGLEPWPRTAIRRPWPPPWLPAPAWPRPWRPASSPFTMAACRCSPAVWTARWASRPWPRMATPHPVDHRGRRGCRVDRRRVRHARRRRRSRPAAAGRAVPVRGDGPRRATASPWRPCSSRAMTSSSPSATPAWPCSTATTCP